MQRILAWIQGIAESLGAPGLLLLSFLDSSFLSFPQVPEILVVLLTIRRNERMLLYALLPTLGSLAGCYALFAVGRRGGGAFLRKRVSQRHLDRAMALFRRYGVMAILVPSLLPPPTPFKAFVLAAGVARVRDADFLIAVAIGRSIRYFGIGFLALWYGEAAVSFVRTHGNAIGLWLGVGILAIALLVLVWKRRGRPA